MSENRRGDLFTHTLIVTYLVARHCVEILGTDPARRTSTKARVRQHKSRILRCTICLCIM